ncbi:putative mannosyl-3-phosphoglycerate phosphatase [Rubripirellula amarantea]|uniref:Putative mannosyl-3-phosphoglycerate phosphatase n=1 Tax=Rubripirellula amarantea TaxID=2527999 RepID=A0A5C5WVS8_9BACT|nr:HAD-IIB family hydrolase [Rubripirellula amarantea]TWT55064.1 putative mannosyl-3-phosphoglycerate phosphatase [Rubripirellula amarantea]
MQKPKPSLIIFTDLDGCLLNKHDYDWSAAAATLSRLRELSVPVIMNSSKTVPEMTQLATELNLNEQTFISENGSVIRWGIDSGESSGTSEVIGVPRDQILTVLRQLKPNFSFRSFVDLGLDGVIAETQLPRDQASMALQRQGTEPLLWDDTEERRLDFEAAIQDHHLTLTRGGRFWHVAGHASKGKAMQRVAQQWAVQNIPALDIASSGDGQNNAQTVTAAIGDSPIDQSMLDVADVPIGIPTKAGLGVNIDLNRGIVATKQGAEGWSQAVSELLLRLDAFPR